MTSSLRASSMNIDDNTVKDGHAVLSQRQVTGSVTTTWAKQGGNTQVEEGLVVPVWRPVNDIPGTITQAWGGHYDSDQEIRSGAVQPVLAFGWQEDRLAGTVYEDEVPSLTTSKTYAVHVPEMAVRRLTPRECERLMGWPDDWTRWTADGSEVADSSRYRMCGNGVASPVAEWIGRCILTAERQKT